MPLNFKNEQDRLRYSKWMEEAFYAASAYDGSPESEAKLLAPLSLMDQFIQASNDNHTSRRLEIRFGYEAKSDWATFMPFIIDDFLDIGIGFHKEEEALIPSFDPRYQCFSV